MKLQTETGIQLGVWNQTNFKQRYLSNFELDSKFGRKKRCRGRQGLKHLFRKFGQNSKYFGIYRVLNAGANSEIRNSVYVFGFLVELQLNEALDFWTTHEIMWT